MCRAHARVVEAEQHIRADLADAPGEISLVPPESE
jgi:hypothetical protein